MLVKEATSSKLPDTMKSLCDMTRQKQSQADHVPAFCDEIRCQRGQNTGTPRTDSNPSQPRTDRHHP